MKKLKTKLNHVAKLLLFGDFPNKYELFNGYKILRKLFNSSFPSESFPAIIRKLKSNLFYRQFKLDTDPCFLKALANQVYEFEVIEKLLIGSEINYSQPEEMVLEQRLNILISLSLLEQGLQEAKSSDEENQPYSEDLFEIYFEDLEKLKKILSSESISIEDIKWFFDSNLFEFILEASDCFNLELVDLYKILLEETEIKSKKDFFDHTQLLKKAEKESSLDYKEFYAVLSTAKKQLAEELKKSPIIPASTSYNSSIFEKIPNLTTLSPIAKKALLNNLKNYEASPYVNSFKR